MKIAHVALWVEDLEKMKSFYVQYLGMKSNEKYENKEKGFSSFILSFDEESAKIELMHLPGIKKQIHKKGSDMGYTHLSISVGGKTQVDNLTNRLVIDGYELVIEARSTGDGFYESCVRDPEGNILEITV